MLEMWRVTTARIVNDKAAWLPAFVYLKRAGEQRL
jgi:hypothetical protein